MNKLRRKIHILICMCALTSELCLAQAPCNVLQKHGEIEQIGLELPDSSADASIIFGQIRNSGDIRIWDSRTGRIINTLHPDGDSFDLATRVLASANGRVAAKLKKRKTVWIGDAFSGRKIAEFAVSPFDSPPKMRISPDGKVLLTGSYEKGAALWNTDTGRLIGVLTHPSLRDALGETRPFLKAVFSPDSKLVATAFFGFTYLWDARSALFLKRLYNTGEFKTKPYGYQTFMYDVEFNPDGSLLAAGGRDGSTLLWEVDSGDIRASLEQGDRVFSVVFSSDGRFLATVSYDDRKIKVWDTNSGKLLYTVKGGKSTPFSVTFSDPEIGLIAVPVKQGVEFRDAASGNLVRKCHDIFGYFLPNGARFIAGLGDGGMALFTIRK